MHKVTVFPCLFVLALTIGSAACDDLPPSEKTCEWMGDTYPVDTQFPAGDGCNTCYCGYHGSSSSAPSVECSLIDCEARDALTEDAPSTDASTDAALPDAGNDAGDGGGTDGQNS